MKIKYSFRFLFAVLFTVILALLFSAKARAQSLNITNTITPAIVFVSVPTNALGLSTGGAIDVRNYQNVGFTFKFAADRTGVGNEVVTIVRANTDGPPTAADWETTPATTLTIPHNGLSAVVWHTNLDAYVLGPARWIGIGSLTNTCASAIATNCSATITKKPTIVRFP